jgi:hypothetical protein
MLTKLGALPKNAEEIREVGTRELRRSLDKTQPITEGESLMAEVITRPEEFTDEPMPEGGNLYQAVARMFGSGAASRNLIFALFLDLMRDYQIAANISSLVDEEISCCGHKLTIKSIGVYCEAIDSDKATLKAQVPIIRQFFELMAATGQYSLGEKINEKDGTHSQLPTTFAEIEQYSLVCLSADFRKESWTWFHDREGWPGWSGTPADKDWPDYIDLCLFEHSDPQSVGFECSRRTFTLTHVDPSRFPWRR